jgi:hypothetical protein
VDCRVQRQQRSEIARRTEPFNAWTADTSSAQYAFRSAQRHLHTRQTAQRHYTQRLLAIECTHLHCLTMPRLCTALVAFAVALLCGVCPLREAYAYQVNNRLPDFSTKISHDNLRPLESRKAARLRALSGEELDMINSATKLEDYVYTPPDVGADIWVGSIVALLPIIWATFEFTSRIRVQQQCLVCSGSGLVSVTKSGNALSRPRKCWSCGGFLPWLGWKMFFLSTFAPGNGGALQRPSADYEATQEAIRSGKLDLTSPQGDSDDSEGT